MNKTEKIKTTVYLSEDAASQVDAILSLTKRLDKREKSIAIEKKLSVFTIRISRGKSIWTTFAASTADKSRRLCRGQQTAYLRSSLNKLLKQTC